MQAGVAITIGALPHVWRGFVVDHGFSVLLGFEIFAGRSHWFIFYRTPDRPVFVVVILHEQINRRSIVASVIGLIGAGVVIGGRLSGNYNVEMGQGILAILCSAVPPITLSFSGSRPR